MPNRRTIKITDTVRAAALKLPLTPSVTKDSEIRGFALIVTTRDVFWVQFLSRAATTPTANAGASFGTDWATPELMVTADARTASQSAKVATQEGGDPHRARLASTASSVARRSIVPQTSGDAAALYAQTINARTHLSDRTGAQSSITSAKPLASRAAPMSLLLRPTRAPSA